MCNRQVLQWGAPIERLCPTKRCAFLFGEVLRCVHFGHKNDKKKPSEGGRSANITAQ